MAATNGPLFKFGNFGQPANNVPVNISNETIFQFHGKQYFFIQSAEQQLSFFTCDSCKFIIVLILLAFLTVGIGLVRNLRRQNSLSGFDLSDDAKTKRAEIVAALDTALYQLGRGGDYRETILECYQKISQIIETKGAFDGSPFHPQRIQENCIRAAAASIMLSLRGNRSF